MSQRLHRLLVAHGATILSILGYQVKINASLDKWRVDLFGFHPISAQAVILECIVTQSPSNVIKKIKSIKNHHPEVDVAVLRFGKSSGQRLFRDAQIHLIETSLENIIG